MLGMGKTLGALCVALSVVLAPDARAEPGGVAPAGFESQLPPTFNAAQGQQMANIFTSCMGPQIQAGIQSLGSTLTGGPGMGSISINSTCPAGTPPGVGDSLSCDSFMIDNRVSSERIRALSTQIDSSIAGMMCQKGKFEAVKGELQCLANQADILTAQIGSLQDLYTNNIQRMQQDVSQLKAVIADRTAQEEEVKALLNGGGESGTGAVGLLRLKEQTQQMIAAMPTEIQGIKEEQKLAAEQRRAFEEQVQTRTMALTAECFKTRGESTYRCTRNGPPVSAYEYVQCRYEQERQVGEDRVVERSKKAQNRAKADAAGLKSVLDSMLGDAPQSAKIPTNPQEGQASMDVNLNILSVADIESQYGDELSRFNAQGFDFHGFVVASLGNCFKRANRLVTREKKRANTALGLGDFRIQQMERATRTKIDGMLTKYSQQYAENMRGLTGMNLPLDTRSCNNAAPHTQAKCLDDIKVQMEGLLKGNVPQSGVQMMVKGNNPKTNIVFTCQGLDGCITTLQNVSRNLATEKKRVDQFKKDYVLRANQNVDRFTKQMATMLSPQSQALTNRLKALNTALASLGVGSGVNIPTLRGERMQKDEDGLYQAPDSALKAIGEQMNPPMLDVSGNSFSSALGGVADGVKRIDQDLARAQDAKARLQSLASTCGAKPVREAIATLRTDVEQLAALRCGTSRAYCGQSQRLGQLVQSVRDLDTGQGLDVSTVDNLATGIEMACPPTLPPAPPPATVQSGQNGGTTINLGQQQPDNSLQCDMIFARLSGKIENVRGAQNAGRAASGSAF
jgi:hypothetical protein